MKRHRPSRRQRPGPQSQRQCSPLAGGPRLALQSRHGPAWRPPHRWLVPVDGNALCVTFQGWRLARGLWPTNIYRSGTLSQHRRLTSRTPSPRRSTRCSGSSPPCPTTRASRGAGSWSTPSSPRSSGPPWRGGGTAGQGPQSPEAQAVLRSPEGTWSKGSRSPKNPSSYDPRKPRVPWPGASTHSSWSGSCSRTALPLPPGSRQSSTSRRPAQPLPWERSSPCSGSRAIHHSAS